MASFLRFARWTPLTTADDGKKTFSVWLRHDKESISLKQTAIEIYGVSDRKAETAK